MSTREELNTRLTQLHNEVKAVQAKKREVSKQLDALGAVDEAQAILDSVSPETKKRLAQQLSASGFANGSSVGTPGA